MPNRQKKRPGVEAYFGIEAKEYGNSQWMARNQIATTESAIQYLTSNEYFGPWNEDPSDLIVLDLGCGTGYSSHVIAGNGFRVLSLDVSRDMMSQIDTTSEMHLVQADMRHLPLRKAYVDHIISISAFNFISSGAKNRQEMVRMINKTIENLKQVLRKKPSRIVIEFYPTEIEEELILHAFKRSGFDGGMLLQHPGTKKEKKFLILRSSGFT